MPELPETETIARELQRLVKGRILARTTVRRPDVLRGEGADAFVRRCAGRRVERVWRRAKSVVIDLEGGEHLVVTPRFTGVLLVDSGEPEGVPDEYVAVEWTLADGLRLVYRDVRRLGTVAIADDVALAAYDARLGVEPLDPSFTAERLSGLLRVSKQAVKKVVMNQQQVAGVGNIYANEALWRAGIDPSREARSLASPEAARLRDALVEVLSASIEARGTTFRDYRDPSNQRGGFAERLQAYGRGGLPCQRCGTTLLETHDIDGRSTVFCWRCQR